MKMRFWFLMYICLAFVVVFFLAGCFEETKLLTLNKDGSGNYESTMRLNPQMSVFVEMAEKIVAAKGLPSTEGSPFGLVSGNLEGTIRAQVEQIEGAHLRKLEITTFGKGDEQKQVTVAIDFDDINAFLASSSGLKNLGLRLSEDDEGNLHLKGTPGDLANIPPAGGGMPGFGMLISQMKTEFGVAGDSEFDALLRRLIDNPMTSLTFVAPASIKQTNGTLVADNEVEWKVDVIDAVSVTTGDLYEIVISGEGLEFEVREIPQPQVIRPSGGAPSSLLGQPAPDFTLANLEGESVPLSDFKGKVVILDFWATWCGPCVVEIPYFVKMHEELAEKGFTMLGVSVDRGADVVRKFVDEHEVNYPILMADANVKTLYGGVRAIPTTFVLDKDGVIQRHYVGTQPESVFRRDVETLLADEELTPQPVRATPPSGAPQPPALAAKPFDGEARIQPLGIQIAATLANPSDPNRWNRIRPFGGPGGGEGTTISLLVTIPTGGIVSVDQRASALTQFSDDTGKDLLVPIESGRFSPASPISRRNIQGTNREYATVFVSAPGRPSENATSVSAGGNIAFVRGGGTETYESSDFALDEEQAFTLGELSYQWAPNTFNPGMAPIGRGGGNLLIGTMTIRGAQTAHDAILETQFFSETGAPIRADASGWSSRGDGGDRTVEKPYGFPASAKVVKMVVTAMTDRELVTVPFEVTAQLNGSGLALEALKVEATTSELPPPPPENPNALNSRAWSYVQQGTNLEEAVKLAKQAVELAPESPVFLDTLAWAYLKTGQYTDALDVFEGILEKLPDFESSWAGLLELAESKVAESDFIEFSERLSEILPDMPRVQLRRNMMMSIWYRNQGDMERAEELFARTGFADENLWKAAGPFPQQYRQGLREVYDAEAEVLSFGLDDINPEKVDWRSINDGRQDGFLNFQETLSPNEEVVAYALIDLVSEADQDATFRIGSDDGVKVWLNGEQVWLNDVYRSAAMDQDTVVAHLQKGRNRLLVKISQGEVDWGFYLRVTDSYGNPIPGVRFVPATIHDE